MARRAAVTRNDSVGTANQRECPRMGQEELNPGSRRCPYRFALYSPLALTHVP